MVKEKYTITKEFLENEYNKNKRTQQEIANTIGCSQILISRKMKRYQIKTIQNTWSKESNPHTINPEKARMTSKKTMTKIQHNMHKWKNDIKLTCEQKSIIFGSLLGDMAIQKPNNKSKNARILETHSIKQKQYLEWKFNKLNNIIKENLRISIDKHEHMIENKVVKRTKKITMRSMCIQCITEIEQIVTINGKKHVNEQWLNNINETAMAVWFMDDGSSEKYRITLSLGNMEHDETILILEMMKNKWNIIAKLDEKKENKKRLLITGKENLLKMEKIMKPTINEIPSMKYKLNFMNIYLERKHFIAI